VPLSDRFDSARRLTVPMFRSRSHLQSIALWLALAGVALRSLVPVGFMPGWTDAAANGGERSWLIICPTSPLHEALASPVARTAQASPLLHHDHAAMQAAQSAAADVYGLHCRTGHHADADSVAQSAAPSADPHVEHAPSQHGEHRIAAEHLSCPFAAAGAPALPVTASAFLVAAVGASTLDVAAPAAAVIADRHRLPPARGPPPRFDDRAVA
jgi:hypothetical protein